MCSLKTIKFQPGLVILDSKAIVRHWSANLPEILDERAIKIGDPWPDDLQGWRRENPWQASAAVGGIRIFAEEWAGYTLLLVSDWQADFSGTATILNSIDEGIHIVNKRGETVFYNPTMASMEGMDYDQVINKDVLALFPSLTPETSTILRALRTKEPVYDKVQTYYNNKGQRITTLNSTIPLWRGSDFIGVLEVAKDVTRLEDLAHKVVDLQQRLYRQRQGGGDQAKLYTFSDIIGNSPALLRPLEIARRAARTSSPVLIYGETGTGKELVAQSIHQLSPRRAKPFIAQNCAALPGTLLEGILFGTVKGSFTGAIDRPGLIEQADGGTLLLDEINSMDIDLQAKLLRVLQERRVRRVGGLKETPVDVRFIATTNTQPRLAISRGSIRQDLYYRLAVVNVNLPPLRQRQSDIQPLCRHFVDKYNRRFGLAVQKIDPAGLALFMAHSWPGNVRELEHVIEGAMNIIGEGETVINLRHLPANLPAEQPGAIELEGLAGHTLPVALEMVEQTLLKSALAKTGGNITRAAKILGISRQSLQYKCAKRLPQTPRS